MLCLTKDRKPGFQKYANSLDDNNENLYILTDVRGTFHQKCSNISSVFSLQRLATQVVAKYISNMILFFYFIYGMDDFSFQ